MEESSTPQPTGETITQSEIISIAASAQSARSETDLRLSTLIDAGIAALLAELSQGKSEQLLRYLQFAARFHTYSLANQWLIMCQCPQASFVAGYRRWQSLGYQVARGSRGIRIWAPRPYRAINPDTGEEEERVRFVAVAVFDASQLDPTQLAARPLPEFFRPLEGEPTALLERLTQVVTDAGIVLEEGLSRGAQGASMHCRIVLKAGLAPTNAFLTLLHEYAHELLHWDEEGQQLSRPIQECEAEAVSYIVAHHFGIQNPFSSDYLQQWGSDAQTLITQLFRVRKAASHIIEQLGAVPAQDESMRHPLRRVSATRAC